MRVVDFVAASCGAFLLVASVAQASRNLAPSHLNGVTCVDYSNLGPSAPKYEIGSRVVDLLNGLHFDDIMIDTPNGMRPPSVVLFFRSQNAECARAAKKLGFSELVEGPSTPTASRLAAFKYDMDIVPKRAWYKFTPEMDLEKRWGVKSCPEVVFVPRVDECDGYTKWCTKPDEEYKGMVVAGCDDYEDKCAPLVKKFTESAQGASKSVLLSWILANIKSEGEPEISPFFSTYHEQERWMRERTRITSTTHQRNAFLSPAFPAFTKLGFKPMETPAEFQEWLLDFYHSNEVRRRTEHWDAESTQMSFHETKTTFVDLDRAYAKKVQMANKYIKPIVQEWAGVDDLELHRSTVSANTIPAHVSAAY